MSNSIKYYMRGAMTAVILLFTSGAIIQIFFTEIGFSGRQIGAYTSLISIAQIVAMVLSIFTADNIKNVKDTLAVLLLSPSLLCLALLPSCFSANENVTIIYYIALLFCVIQNLFLGFSNVLTYRLPYLIIPMSDYAKLENNNGIISGIFSIVISSIISFLATIFPFRRIMAFGFILSLVFCLFSFILIKSMKIKTPISQPTEKESFSFKKLLKREFKYFYMPNFLRGLAMGLINIISVVCVKEITTNASVISGLAVLLSVASIVGCALYQLFRRKLKTSTLYMICSIQMFLFLPGMLIGKNVSIFCICYFIACIGYNIINVSGAVYATEIISYTDIGTYTSVRLIVMTLGQAISSYGVAVAMEYMPSVVILTICGMAQLISGIMYYLYDMRYRKS